MKSAPLHEYHLSSPMRAKPRNDHIAENVLNIATRRQIPRKAIGVDEILPGILKASRNWRSGNLDIYFKNHWIEKQSNGRKGGIMIFRRKSGGGNIVRNYRPIEPLPTICKLRDTLLRSIFPPVLNLLTKDMILAYKCKKSTMGIIYAVQKHIAEKQIYGLILLGLSKASAWINRHKLWDTCYEYGPPGDLIRALVLGRDCAHLFAQKNTLGRTMSEYPKEARWARNSALFMPIALCRHTQTQLIHRIILE